MSLAAYIKEIGRGREGARALSRDQAADLMAQVLDGRASDLEIGAFCLAMRIKGESPDEMAGFWDAAQPRLLALPPAQAQPGPPGPPLIVLPSYNGARRLPVLTPLLALLLARQGLSVLVHGQATEDRRVTSRSVLDALGVPVLHAQQAVPAGQVRFAPMDWLCPGLHRLLNVRRVVGLRNSAHSLVKLLTPCQGPALLVSSYTHPEYASSMARTLQLLGRHALLLRGTEGEPVADARRMPPMEGFIAGQARSLQEAQTGTLQSLPALPAADADATAHYCAEVLAGERPVPDPIARQVQLVLQLAAQVQAHEHRHAAHPPVPSSALPHPGAPA